MTWVRIDDGFADHPKIKHAGPLAIAAQVRALCYCARFLTNGRLPARVVDEIFVDLKPLKPSDMVLAKLWQKRSGGYVVHDYLEYNPDRKTVIELRGKRVRSGQLGGLAKAIADGQARAIANARASGIAPNPAPTPTTKALSEVSMSHDDERSSHEAKKAAALELLKRAGLHPPKES